MTMVLVTGGAGFIGSHTILELLRRGQRVRTTLRQPGQSAALRALLQTQGVDAGPQRLQCLAADLDVDTGWAEVMQGCETVLHVASPFPRQAPPPAQAESLVATARDGSLRVLRAARQNGVRRVVLMSSFAAVGYGQTPRNSPFTEADWTRPEGADVTAYIRSKLLAERAAWDFVAQEGGSLELVALNPVGVFGPTLGPQLSASVRLVLSLLAGALPLAPKLHFGCVDVRDLVDLQLRALAAPQAAGQRYIAASGPAISLPQAAQILRRHLGTAARRVPRFAAPDALVRTLALMLPALRGFVPQLGIARQASAEKARQQLGWSPRSAEIAIADCGRSLIDLGLIAAH
jgi:dihydroflavonol-4-reductase